MVNHKESVSVPGYSRVAANVRGIIQCNIPDTLEICEEVYYDNAYKAE